MSLKVGGLLVPLLLLTACGGEVANGDVSPSAPATTAATPSCQEGNDDSVDSSGADTFTPISGVTATPQPNGLTIVDVKVGDGATIASGQCVTVHYTGWLTNGTKFDSSRDHGKGFRFQVGQGGVIPGWDQGVPGMKVNGARLLVIPPALAYGANGSPPTIPANATLEFLVTAAKVTP